MSAEIFIYSTFSILSVCHPTDSTVTSKMLLSLKVWLACAACNSAREIAFPPLAGVKSFQERLRDDDGIDISTGSDFHGLMTFANLPYANCFKDSHDGDTLESDIFLLGAPFDTVSLPNQPGKGMTLRDRRSTDCSTAKVS